TTSNPHTRLDCGLRTGWKKHVHPRSESNQADEFPLGYRIPHLLPAYNAAGYESRNLIKHQFGISLGDHYDISLILDSRRVIVRGLERPPLVINRFDTPRNRTAVDMNIENRKKNAQLRYIADPLDLYNPPVRWGYNDLRIGRNFTRWIPKEE